jgi:hypothetical protein
MGIVAIADAAGARPPASDRKAKAREFGRAFVSAGLASSQGPDRAVLYVGRDLRLVFVPAARTDVLVATFSPLGHSRAADAPGFAEGFLLRHDYPALHFISSWDHWWQTAEMEAALSAAATVIAQFPQVITYGTSMGAYGALAFSMALRATKVLAFSPQFTVDPEKPPYERRWKHHASKITFINDDIVAGIAPAADVHVFYDRFSQDTAHVRLLQQQENVVAHSLPFAGHGTPGALAICGMLSSTVCELLDGTFTSSHLAWRFRIKKRETFAYWSLLADHCYRGRRYALARLATDRALAIEPRSKINLDRKVRIDRRLEKKCQAANPSDLAVPKAARSSPKLETPLQ